MYAEIVRLIEDNFPHGVYLFEADYRDSLTEDQAEWYVTGNWEPLIDSILEWESDSRWYGTDWYVEELIHRLRNIYPAFDPDEEWIDTVREVLMELDQSDALGDLVGNTSYKIPMGKWLIDEDNAVWGLHDVDGLIKALGVPDTADNRAVAEELIYNAPTDLGMAFAAYEVCPSDMHEIGPGRAAIRTEHLPICYGNPFTGGYWAGAFKLGAPVTIPLSELSPISHMMAYGPSEVYGEFPYTLECDKEFVEIGNNN